MSDKNSRKTPNAGRQGKNGDPNSKQTPIIVNNGTDSSDNTTENEIEQPWTCNKCEIIISDKNDLALECSICSLNYCIPCVKMVKAEYNLLQQLSRDDVLWVCPVCSPKLKALCMTTELVAQLQSDLDNKILGVEKTVIAAFKSIQLSFQSSIDKLEKSIQTNITNELKTNTKSVTQTVNKSATDIKSNVKKTFAEALKSDQTAQTGIFRTVMEEQRKERNKEEGDKEERLKNFII